MDARRGGSCESIDEPKGLLATALAELELTSVRLDASERRQRALYEAAQAIQAQTTLDGRLAAVAESAGRLMGTGEVAIGLVDPTDDGALEYLYSQGRAASDLLGVRLRRGEGLAGTILQTGTPARSDDLMQDPRGGLAQFVTTWQVRSWMGIPLVDADSVIGVLVLWDQRPARFRDEDEQALTLLGGLAGGALREARLTDELREAERRARVLAESLLEVVYEADLTRPDRPGGVTTFYGGNMEQLVGISREAAYANPSYWIERLHPDDRERVQQARDDLLRDGETLDVEYRFFKPGGETVWLEERARLERDERGAPRSLRGTLANVTERKRLERQVAETDRLRALGTMAAGVAHDFNNLLALVVGRAELALLQIEAGQTDADSLSEALREIVQAAQDGAATVRRLQGYVRQQPATSGAPFDLAESVRLAVTLAQPRWRDEPQRRGVTVSVDLRLEDGLVVQGDAAAMRQALTNLLFNAVDAMPGGGQIEIAASRDASTAILEVSDSGLGMPDHVRQHCFDPFFTTKGARGTGLGLAEVYGVVKRHAGEIAVQSVPGEGTVFTVRVPLLDDAMQPSDAAPTPRATAGLRVLVVDDEPGLMHLLVALLSASDHSVTPANGGAEAIRELQARAFDLVITDLGMPDVSGWDVVRAALRSTPLPYVALATGWGGALDPEEVARTGVNDVLSKPYTMADLQRLAARAQAWLRGEALPA